jgi:hypothetical protein
MLRSRRLDEFADEPAFSELYVPGGLASAVSFPDMVLCYMATSFGVSEEGIADNSTAVGAGHFVALVDDGICSPEESVNSTWSKFVWEFSQPSQDVFEWNGGLYFQPGPGQAYAASPNYHLHFSVNATDESNMSIQMYYGAGGAADSAQSFDLCGVSASFSYPSSTSCNLLTGTFDASEASGIPAFTSFIFDEYVEMKETMVVPQGRLEKFRTNVMKTKKTANGVVVTSAETLVSASDNCTIDEAAFGTASGGLCTTPCTMFGTQDSDEQLNSGIMTYSNDLLSIQSVVGNISSLPSSSGDTSPSACLSLAPASTTEYVNELRAFNASTGDKLSFNDYSRCVICRPGFDCSAYATALDRNGLDLSADANLTELHFELYFSPDGFGWISQHYINQITGEVTSLSDITGDGEDDGYGYFSKYNPADGAVLTCIQSISDPGVPAQVKVKGTDVLAVGSTESVASCPTLPAVPIEDGDFTYAESGSCSSFTAPTVTIPASVGSASLAVPPLHKDNPAGYSTIDGVQNGDEFTFYN